MKKLFFTMALAMVTFFGSAQEEVEKFEVTPDGINGYVVEEFSGKTAQQLYEAVKEWAQYNLGSADKAKQSQIESEYLKYKVFNSNISYIKNAWEKFYFSLEETVEFRFKDGKVRFDIAIDALPFEDNNYNNGVSLRGNFTTYSFYKNNGKPKSAAADGLQDVNKHLNSIVTRVSDYINEDSKEVNNSDW